MAQLTKDHVWVWDGPANNLGPSIYGLGDATAFFGLENLMAMWMPTTTAEAVALAKLKRFKRVVWELTTSKWQRRPFTSVGHYTDISRTDREHIGWFKEDSWSVQRGWESKAEAAKISQLSKEYPNLAGGLLDYSFGGFAHRGGTPADLRDIAAALKKDNPALDLHWMVYTNDLDAKWADYVPYIDVVSYWEPKRENLRNLDESIEKCAAFMPGKPILLGLYMVDYWAKRLAPGEEHRWKWHADWAIEPIPEELLEVQFGKAIELVQRGKIAGFQILAESMVDKFPATARWIRDYLSDRLARG